MSKRLEYYYDNLKKLKIGLDELFKFNCTMCGKCCINREDILLNPKDLFNIAKALELQPIDVVEKYCDTYIGESSRFPIVRLKPQGNLRRCPLLKDKKCMVHSSKPTVCAMFPIGRVISVEGTSKIDLSSPWDYSKIQYIFDPPHCGDDSVTHTVREWFTSFGIDIEDEFYIKWNMVLGNFSKICRKAEKNFKMPKTTEYLWNALFASLYCSYDTQNDFMEQFENNVNQIKPLMQQIDLQYEDEKPKTMYHKKVKKKKWKKQKNKSKNGRRK